jgi:hypothetical protein
MKLAVLTGLLLLPVTLVAQESVDAAMNMKFRAEGLERSRIAGVFDTLTTVMVWSARASRESSTRSRR